MNKKINLSVTLDDRKGACSTKKIRLTDQRKKVLEIIQQSPQPIGAYAILEKLSKNQKKIIAPPTVYRVLKFLLTHHLVHRIASLNAFINCVRPKNFSQCQCYFLICRICNNATELVHSTTNQTLQNEADDLNFIIEDQLIEAFGVCMTCQKKS